MRPYSHSKSYRVLSIRAATDSRRLYRLASEYSDFDRNMAIRLSAIAALLQRISTEASARQSRDGLPPGQARVMLFLQRHLSSRGRAPTRSEIARALGFRSANAAECHLRDLCKKGYIKILPKVTAGIRLNKVYVPPDQIQVSTMHGASLGARVKKKLPPHPRTD